MASTTALLDSIRVGQLDIAAALRTQQHTVPVADAAWWRKTANCYALGVDQRFQVMPIPGEFARIMGISEYQTLALSKHSVLSEVGLRVRLALDGLELITTGFTTPNTRGWVVVVMLAPGKDFHLIRCVGPGLLVHKRGEEPLEQIAENTPLFHVDENGVQTPYQPLAAYWVDPNELGVPRPGARRVARHLAALPV